MRFLKNSVIKLPAFQHDATKKADVTEVKKFYKCKPEEREETEFLIIVRFCRNEKKSSEYFKFQQNLKQIQSF